MKRNIILSVFLGLIILLGVSVSYSMWIMTNSQGSTNAVETTNKCFNVELTSESDNIKLENAYPITDEAGSKLNPYSFKITNTCEWNAYYKVNLETLSNSSINSDLMKVSLNNKSSKKLSEYVKTDKVLDGSKESETLKTGYLPVGGSVSFDLRVWMDYETTIADIKNDGTDKWIGKIVVVSSLVEDKEILAACQNKGGDLIDEGECRKYYVKLNQQFNINDVFVTGYTFEINDSTTNSFSLTTVTNSFHRFGPFKSYKVNNLYYIYFNSKLVRSFTAALQISEENYPKRATMYSWKNSDNYYYYRFLEGENSYIIVPNSSDWSQWYFENNNNVSLERYITVDLTLMFGDGNEPDKEWCDKYLTNYLEYNSEGIMTPIKEIVEPVKTSYYDKIDMFD